jgi:hypothetical protein
VAQRVNGGAPPLPGLRLKSRWFESGTPRTPTEQAGVMGFVVFRVGRQLLERMRRADFDVAIGGPYLDFLSEVLAFLVAVVDRIAHARLDGEGRAAFTAALVHHVARHLAENEREYRGPEAPGAATYEDRFVDLANTRFGDYAEFGAEPAARDPSLGFEPEFAFVRCFGAFLEAAVPAKDRLWVIDQVMAVEAPEALAQVRRTMRELLDPAPRPRRRSTVTGE